MDLKKRTATILLIGAVALLFLSGTLIFHASSTKKITFKPSPSPLPSDTLTPTLTSTPTPSPSSPPLNTPTGKESSTSSGTTASTTIYPSKVLNLSNWKITLPTGSSGHPDEVKQPELNTFKVDPWFVATSDGKAVRFRAAVNGVTTSGSHYPRSELREMTDNGVNRASWSSTSGIHEMTLEESITSVPVLKKHVVAGQIHDASDDILVIRLEYPNLYVNVGGKNVYTLDSDYTLGKRFKVKFLVEGGQIKVYYNDSADPVYTLTKDFSGAYFKAGAYTQSNCLREVNPFVCNDNNYGEVVIYSLDVSHH